MINTALLKEQLKRFWAVPVLSGLGYALLILLPLTGESPHVTRNAILTIVMIDPQLMVLMIVIPLVSVFCTMWWFFSRRASTVFYAFPISKGQLLATNALAGIILTLLPLIVLFLTVLSPVFYQEPETMTWINNVPQPRTWLAAGYPAAIFPNGLAPGDVVNSFPVVLGLVARVAVVKLFYFGLFWLAISLAGHGIVAVLIIAAMALTPVVVVSGIEALSPMFVFGALGQSMDYIELTLLLTNAVTWGEWFFWDNVGFNPQSNMPLFILYLGISAAFFAAATGVSRIRKPERIGNSVMFTPVQHVLIFIVAVAAMVIAGAMGYFLAGESPLAFHAGMVVGFIVGYLFGQMIAERTFLIGSKVKYLLPFGGAALVMYLLVLFITQIGFNSFVNHVPNREEIVGVYLGPMRRHGLQSGQMPNVFIEDDHIINRATDMHRLILSERRYLHNTIWRTNWHTGAEPAMMFGIFHGRGSSFNSNIEFTYLLSDGSYLRRSYQITGEFFETSGLRELWHSDEVILSHTPIFRSPQFIETISLNYIPEMVEGVFADGPDTGQLMVSRITHGQLITDILEVFGQNLIADSRALTHDDIFGPHASEFRWNESPTITAVVNVEPAHMNQYGSFIFFELRRDEYVQAVLELLRAAGFDEF